MFNSIEEALADLKLGKPIIVVDDEDRENEGDFVALSDQMTAETINFMITYGKGLVCTAITEELADQLALPLMVENNTDPYGTAFTVSVDHKSTRTGISAQERADTIIQLTQKETKAEDFKRPGHVFPLIAKRGGVLERPGHTEAAVDLARLCHAYPSATICEIVNEDGTMARLPSLQKLAKRFALKIVTIEALQAYRKEHELLITREIETKLPTKYGSFQAFAYKNPFDQQEHLAFVKGDISKETSTIVRIHSECLTGDMFGSYRCDCGPQLESALQTIADKGHGVLVYMRQEGRGIGLLNKLKAYNLQDSGLDTVEANEALGFADDEREYYLSAQILKDLGVENIQLMTNNPRKITELEENGIIVEERLAIEVPTRNENQHYMETKRIKLGHELVITK